MLSRYFRGLVAALAMLSACPASAVVSPPVLVPSSPLAGEVLSIDVTAGTCDAFLGSTTPIPVTQNGTNLRVVLPSLHETNSLFCNYGSGTGRYVISAFQAGTYTLQIDRSYSTVFGTVVEPLATTQLVVRGVAQETPMPATSPLALLILAAGLALIAARKKIFLSLAALLFVFNVDPSAAQEPTSNTAYLLVRASPGDPSADDVIAYINSSPRAAIPPIPNLDTGNPTEAHYLFALRAQGDFKDYLDQNPNSSRGRLERYIVVSYPAKTNIDTVVSTLMAEPLVAGASKPLPFKFSSASLIGYGFGEEQPLTSSTLNQYGRDLLYIDRAWQLAGGYALIGIPDSGLATNHDSLRQFSPTGQYVGGNFIPAASYDMGGIPAYEDANVDEAQPALASGGNGCPRDGSGLAVPTIAGHGTHVAGLAAANSNGTLKGTCRNCGLAVIKATWHFCRPAPDTVVYTAMNAEQIVPAFTKLVDSGAQIINQSYGSPGAYEDVCARTTIEPYCDAVANAFGKGTLVVAAAGNDRSDIDFPASDHRVLSVGGVQENFVLWDESPGTTSSCPLGGDVQCGSNYAKLADPDNERADQELVAAAPRVWSLTYPGKNWNNDIKCGDGYPGPGFSGGQGICTGTSMATPQIAGVAGILRSINPLVMPSDPVVATGQGGIRTVLAQNTFQTLAGLPKSDQLGFGFPNVEAAAKRMLGKVAGATIKNRVTPLFRLKSTGASDYADTTSPQFALALRFAVASYTSDGQTVPGYSSFPYEVGTPAPPTPRAAAYVLTTEYTPNASYPPLRPLYLMSKGRIWPPGCTGDPPACIKNAADYTLMATVSDVEQAHAGGYDLRTIQGYIYSPCSPEPSCIPPAAKKLWRACKTSASDCAVFLESERSTFEANGYTSAYPSGSSKLLGYAYDSTDSDGDGLVDGFEYVVGTNPTMSDSDGIGFGDALALPMVGLQISDPCLGVGAINCPGDKIFKNGFQ